MIFALYSSTGHGTLRVGTWYGRRGFYECDRFDSRQLASFGLTLARTEPMKRHKENDFGEPKVSPRYHRRSSPPKGAQAEHSNINGRDLTP